MGTLTDKYIVCVIAAAIDSDELGNYMGKSCALSAIHVNIGVLDVDKVAIDKVVPINVHYVLGIPDGAMASKISEGCVLVVG